eukprot:Seg4528.2 transcript_id=Seg4528.2/GoldUCD/mRNA.D3Y31 product="Metabotropic glutamate receptor 4" protein_id=Seg4528.2/GoldUCD/D3Y31
MLHSSRAENQSNIPNLQSNENIGFSSSIRQPHITDSDLLWSVGTSDIDVCDVGCW